MSVEGFTELVPERIFKFAERFGGTATGRFLGLNALENRVYEVEIEHDDGRMEKRIVKFYRPGRWSRQTVEAEHQFLKSCAAAEVPVVQPIADESGRTLFDDQGILCAAFPKMRGRLESDLNRTQLERLGRYLARLHNVGAAMPPQPRQRLDAGTFGRAPLAFMLESGAMPADVRPRYETVATRVIDACEQALKPWPAQLVHGDCHQGNVLWNGDEPVFIDFDDILYAPPVQDIWMLTGGDPEEQSRKRGELLDGYEQIRDFDWGSLAIVEALRSLRMIHFAGWLIRRRDDGAIKQAFPLVGTDRFWQEQLEGLYAQSEKLSPSF
ncbi:serine/threonine protein kinase [bacterium]|nr:serine/threonine protein kinase [bacterium]